MYRYGRVKKEMDTLGDLETPTIPLENVEHLGLTEYPVSLDHLDMPMDMNMYDPILRRKKSRAASFKRFPCMSYHCAMNMILRDNNNNLHKILYSHA